MTSGAQRRRGKVIFITGTDTGVGKTLFAGLLLHHLRKNGCHALAMKPFCSGSRADAEFLQAMQDGKLKLEEINPFYFSEPVAPLVAARRHRRAVRLQAVVRRIERIAARCDVLLIEGSGGLLVPLGQGYSVRDLIKRLGCEVIIVARNRLGTINHTLLTVAALRNPGKRRLKIVLTTQGQTDFSSATNRQILSELLAPIEVHALDFLGADAGRPELLKKSQKKVKKVLARLCGSYNLSSFFTTGRRQNKLLTVGAARIK